MSSWLYITLCVSVRICSQISENLLHLAVGYRNAHERGDMSFTDGLEAGPHSDLRIQQEGTQELQAFSQEQKTLLQVGPPKSPGPTLVDSKVPKSCRLPPYDSQRPSEKSDRYPHLDSTPVQFCPLLPIWQHCWLYSPYHQ